MEIAGVNSFVGAHHMITQEV